jgi:hypothetical protein
MCEYEENILCFVCYVIVKKVLPTEVNDNSKKISLHFLSHPKTHIKHNVKCINITSFWERIFFHRSFIL